MMMDPHYRLTNFFPANQQTCEIAAQVWNPACGQKLSITPAFVHYNTQPVSGVKQDGQIVYHNQEPVAFILVSYEVGSPSPSMSGLLHTGWLDAMAVHPEHQRKGIGSELVSWAQNWLVSRGCKVIHLGGSLRPFTPGLPVELSNLGFFLKRGFKDRGFAWDLSHDLGNYQPIRDDRVGLTCPLRPDQEELFRRFLKREFPERWLFEFEESVRTGERLTDYQVLWAGGEINGMVILTFEDSPRPLDRYYLHGLPRPWGQLGTVGVSKSLRGQGYGALILDSGLRRLAATGVRGCVIDWTGLLDFYGKYGFTPYRQYHMLVKDFNQ